MLSYALGDVANLIPHNRRIDCVGEELRAEAPRDAKPRRGPGKPPFKGPARGPSKGPLKGPSRGGGGGGRKKF